MEKYYSYNYFEQKYNLNRCGISNLSKRDELEKKGILKSKILNGKKVYSEESIKMFYEHAQFIRENYYSIREFFEVFEEGYYPAEYKIDIKKYKEILKRANIELISLDFYLDGVHRHFVKKSDYENFKIDYVSIAEAFNNVGGYKSFGSFVKKLNMLGVEFVKFKNKYTYKFIYVKKGDLNFTNNKTKIVTMSEAVKLLNLPINKFYQILKEYNIEVRKDTYDFFSFIEKKDVDYLLNVQKKICDEFNEKFYILDEAIEYFNLIGYRNKNSIDNSITRVKIPAILGFDKKFKNKNMVYLKSDFDNFYNEKKRRLDIIKIYDNAPNFEDDFTHFLAILEEKNCVFGGNKFTEETWFMYVKSKLNNTASEGSVKLNLIRNFVNITQFLVTTLNGKEIYNFKEKELNLMIFNNNVQYQFKNKIRVYLKELNDSLLIRNLKPIKIKELNFKREYETLKTKNYYSIDEFLKFYNIINDYRKIKDIIIDDLKVGNIKKYKKFDSIWLYMLIHLCNGWRSSDILNFKRIDPHIYESFRIKNIEDLRNLKIELDVAKKVVNSFQINIFEHHKTGEAAKFYCPDSLSISFTFAVIFCEFRLRNFQIIESEYLINFYNKYNSYSKKIGNRFLQILQLDFEFEFESMKMNRSLLSIYSSISRKEGKDSIQVPKHIRGHLNAEMTNYYIEISDEDIDEIIEKLFDFDYFGYVYKTLSKSVISIEDQKDNELIHSNSKVIKLIFGDILKIENSAITLSYLSQRNKDINLYLDKYSQEELNKNLKLIKLGLNYSKIENFQCLFAECIAKSSECSKCPFAIPHFYSLMVLSERIKVNVNKFLDEEKRKDVNEGELKRLYKLLVKDYIMLLEAEEAFGVEIIEYFLQEDADSLANRLKSLKDPEQGVFYEY